MGRKKIWEKKKKFSKQKKTDKNKFKLKKRDLRELEKKGLVKEGMFIGNQKGFGFVELEDEEDDIFIPANAVGTAMHQDTVRVLVKEKNGGGKRHEGKIIEILERGTTEVVGTFQRERDYGFVLCDIRNMQRISISRPRTQRESVTEIRLLRKSLITVMRGTSRRAGSRRIWEVSMLRERTSWQS